MKEGYMQSKMKETNDNIKKFNELVNQKVAELNSIHNGIKETLKKIEKEAKVMKGREDIILEHAEKVIEKVTIATDQAYEENVLLLRNKITTVLEKMQKDNDKRYSNLDERFSSQFLSIRKNMKNNFKEIVNQINNHYLLPKEKQFTIR